MLVYLQSVYWEARIVTVYSNIGVNRSRLNTETRAMNSGIDVRYFKIKVFLNKHSFVGGNSETI